jgi:hypothetical protein
MPIHETPDGRIVVEFGAGDVGLYATMSRPDMAYHDTLSLAEVEPGEVGFFPNRAALARAAPVALTFGSLEALDVTIKSLKLIRDLMARGIAFSEFADAVEEFDRGIAADREGDDHAYP